eukprot:1172592-Prorocentrum_minimum.AAC.2
MSGQDVVQVPARAAVNLVQRGLQPSGRRQVRPIEPQAVRETVKTGGVAHHWGAEYGAQTLVECRYASLLQVRNDVRHDGGDAATHACLPALAAGCGPVLARRARDHDDALVRLQLQFVEVRRAELEDVLWPSLEGVLDGVAAKQLRTLLDQHARAFSSTLAGTCAVVDVDVAADGLSLISHGLQARGDAPTQLDDHPCAVLQRKGTWHVVEPQRGLLFGLLGRHGRQQGGEAVTSQLQCEAGGDAVDVMRITEFGCERVQLGVVCGGHHWGDRVHVVGIEVHAGAGGVSGALRRIAAEVVGWLFGSRPVDNANVLQRPVVGHHRQLLPVDVAAEDRCGPHYGHSFTLVRTVSSLYGVQGSAPACYDVLPVVVVKLCQNGATAVDGPVAVEEEGAAVVGVADGEAGAAEGGFQLLEGFL